MASTPGAATSRGSRTPVPAASPSLTTMPRSTERPRSFTGTDQSYAGALLDSQRILRVGGEVVCLDQVRGDYFCYFLLCQRRGEMVGGGEVTGLALAL